MASDEFFLGIDLGGTNVEIGLLDRQGRIVAHQTEPTRSEEGPTSMAVRSAAVCRSLIDQADLTAEQVGGLGIGSPGPLSISQGKLINLCNLPGFDNFDLRAEMSSRLQIPALLDNDANAACWGEFWLGAGRDVRDMVLFTLGTGIGGGIVLEGKLVHGSDDNGAELGHMIIRMDGRLCGCGQKGCVEAYASATATVARALDALDEGRASSLRQIREKKGTITSKDVFDHAQAGDSFATEIVEGTARALALASISMRHITEPEMVVFTGGMIKAGDFLLSRIRKNFDQMVWTLKKEPLEICFARLGGNAGFIGAAGLALYACDHQPQWLYPPGQ